MGSSAAAPSGDLLPLLAHELRQPLSTIESIAYYLTLILPEDEKVHDQLNRIQQLVEQSNWMLISSHFLSDALPAAHERIDLEELIGQIELGGLDLAFAGPLPPVRADAALLRASLENLVMLFRQFPGRPALRLAAGPYGASLEFSTAAAGYRGEGSLAPGSTLSIQGVRRVAESLGGSLDIAIDPASGITLRLVLTRWC